MIKTSAKAMGLAAAIFALAPFAMSGTASAAPMATGLTCKAAGCSGNSTGERSAARGNVMLAKHRKGGGRRYHRGGRRGYGRRHRRGPRIIFGFGGYGGGYGYGYGYGFPGYGYGGYGYGYPGFYLPLYGGSYYYDDYGYAPRHRHRTRRAGYRAGSKKWRRRCARKYRSFNPVTGRYRTRSGKYRKCRLP